MEVGAAAGEAPVLALVLAPDAPAPVPVAAANHHVNQIDPELAASKAEF